MTRTSQTRIFLEDMAIEAPVGFCDWERHPERPTVLRVTVELFSDQTRWADDQGAYKLENLIDYTRVHNYISTWPKRRHTESLEELCEDLLAFCFADRRVSSCRVKIAKPNVYADAAGAGVEIFRVREQDKAG